MAKRLEEFGYTVISTDLINRGYGIGGCDFLRISEMPEGCHCILTNPPYKYAQEMIEHALNIMAAGDRLYFFLKIQFLEGKSRRKLFEKKHLKTVYVSSSRISCAMNGDFARCPSSAVAYAWYEFEKGYGKEPVIRWIN